MPINYVQNVNFHNYRKSIQFPRHNNILPADQKGCREVSYGCKDQLLIKRMLLENSCSLHRNLSTTWIDITEKLLTMSHTHGS